MPKYDFSCETCGHVEEQRTDTDIRWVLCAECDGKSERQFHVTSAIQTPLHFKLDRNWCLPDDRAGYEAREKTRDRVHETFKPQPKDTGYRDAMIETAKRAKAQAR